MTLVTDRQQFFDRLAPKRERDASRHRVYYDDRIRWLRSCIPERASVVEIGCGVGRVLRALPNASRTGIDFSREMITRARAADPNAAYIEEDIEHLTHADRYDTVLMLDTINFLGDVQEALRNIREHLCHERTRLFITSYNFLWSPIFLLGELLGWKTKFPEQNWLGKSDIRNLLTITGFELIEERSRVLLPLAVPGLAPLCNRILASLPFFRLFCLTHCFVARPVGATRREYSVTVLSAVRNERGNIAPIAERMPVMGASTELIFVEGHSTDGTWEEMQRVASLPHGTLTVRALQQSGTGKANALHEGASASKGDIIIVYDGDYTVDPQELRKLYDVLAEGRAEFMNGSRLVYPLQRGAMRMLNLLGNKVFSLLFSWLFAQRIVDSLSPVKAFFRSDYEQMTTRLDPFGDFDFFYGAAKLQCKMCEVPVHYLPRSYGTTKMRPFRHAWRLFTMFLYGARRLRWV